MLENASKILSAPTETLEAREVGFKRIQSHLQLAQTGFRTFQGIMTY